MVNKAHNAKECYDLGSKAKRLGWMRVTPFYEQERASYWWLAGYDAIDFDLAAEQQPEFPGRTMTAKAARRLGLPIPEGVDQVTFHESSHGKKIIPSDCQAVSGAISQGKENVLPA